ncbi:MAG TPA: GNAT family N-acetyltransferase [Candidatus Binatus sp.]|nr:GNAT family N-acetyltransferase [Candidatus Binatus sp.]
MSIRDANEADLPAIVAIYNAAILGRTATADTHLVTVESRRAWFHDHDRKTRPLWVALENDIIVGWLSFQSFYGRPAYHATAELSIYIAADFQRKGIGNALLARAIEQASRLGLKNLLGFIFAHNDASARLFEKFGFQHWGVLPRVAEVDGMERDLIIVGCRIA